MYVLRVTRMEIRQDHFRNQAKKNKKRNEQPVWKSEMPAFVPE